jgi:hypothetical protein
METKMNKKIFLGLAAGVVLSLSAMGCGGNGNNGGNGGSGGSGGGTGSTPDMGFVCVKAPTSGTDFLNGCPPAGVDKVLIAPFYPSLAPNGKLPTLQ